MSPGLPANKRTNEKSYAIQCLRAVAALMVVLNHSVEVMNVHSHLQWAFVYGNYGVDVFFVISGFIMLFSTPETMTAMGFLARRLIRIIPLYWTMTILFSLAAVIAPHLFNAAHPDPVRLVK
jgi:exopolysaccharide production protein ExoZ